MGYHAANAYTLPIGWNTQDGAGSIQTLYFGLSFSRNPNTGFANRKFQIPKGGVITRVSLFMFPTVAQVGAETATLYVRNIDTSTDYVVDNAILLTTALGTTVFNKTLSIPVANDAANLVMKLVLPAYGGTIPTGILAWGTLYIESE